MNLEYYIRKQIEFSEETFGPGKRYTQVIDHITKEVEEVKENPDDLEEWIDIITLALDGAWRTGYSPEVICAMMEYKLEKNKMRDWPDWKTHPEGKAIEHL